ncbi:hypothetical protein ACFX13_015621 [Malus domestica]
MLQRLTGFLQHCIMYCSILSGYYGIPKGKLIRLLVARGLVQEKLGRFMEDVAEENLYELISQGMLQIKEKHSGTGGTRFQVPSPVRELCVHQVEEGNSVFTSIKYSLQKSEEQHKARYEAVLPTVISLRIKAI